MRKGKYTRAASGPRKLLTGLSLVFLSLFLVFFLLGSLRLAGAHREQQKLEALSQLVGQTPTASSEAVPTLPSEEAQENRIAWRGPEDAMLPRYEPLHGMNGELFGWLTVGDTRIDYPVMHSPEEPERYLHGDFNREYAFAGTPFLDGNNGPDSHQLLVYGHNMAGGTMFHDLFRYGSRDFWEEHRTIRLDTLHDRYEFEVMAVLYDRVYLKTDDVFKFYQFGSPATEEEFREAVDYYKTHSLYDTGVTAEYGDQLLTLVTCAYQEEDGRFLVVARKKP